MLQAHKLLAYIKKMHFLLRQQGKIWFPWSQWKDTGGDQGPVLLTASIPVAESPWKPPINYLHTLLIGSKFYFYFKIKAK